MGSGGGRGVASARDQDVLSGSNCKELVPIGAAPRVIQAVPTPWPVLPVFPLTLHATCGYRMPSVTTVGEKRRNKLTFPC